MATSTLLAREKLLETARTLPAAPQVLAALGELLQDVNADIAEVGDLIKRDAALTARVIRMGNSAVFGGGGVGSLDEAVGRVGFGEIYRIVGAAATASLADRALAFYGIEAEALRESLLFHAIASEEVAQTAGLDVRPAYTAGLLRALGMMVLDRVARERLSAAEAFDPARHTGYVMWEGISFGLSNAEVASMILSDWRFPAEVVAGVREHLLLRSSDFGSRLACVLNVAGALAAETGRALPGDRAYWALEPRRLEIVGLSADDARAAGERAQHQFERLRLALA
ncbi:MAG TPA: HDOD domain-containing protein [Opitutaceae bacterium]